MKKEVKWLAPGHMGSHLLRVDFLIETLIHLGHKGFYNIPLKRSLIEFLLWFPFKMISFNSVLFFCLKVTGCRKQEITLKSYLLYNYGDDVCFLHQFGKTWILFP